MSGFCMAQRWALGPPCAAPGPVLILARPYTTPAGEIRHDVRHLRVQAGPAAGRGAPRVWFNSVGVPAPDRKSTRLNSSHGYISYAVFCLKKKKKKDEDK